MQQTQRWFRIATSLVAVLMLLTACGGNADESPEAPGADGGGGEAESTTLEVTAVDNSFDPSSLSASAGSEVTVELTNEGDNPHTFTIDEPQADTSTIDGGDSGTATFVMPETSVTFYCAIHGEKAMAGTIDPS